MPAQCAGREASIALSKACFTRFLDNDAPLHNFLDAGPALAASLYAELSGDVDPLTRLLDRSFDHLGEFPMRSGLSGGLAGLFAATQMATEWLPELASLSRALRKVLANCGPTEQCEPLEWHHYDLVSGPAGVLLALSLAGEQDQGETRAMAQVLADLCGSHDLEQLRIFAYRDDEQLAWHYGKTNTGLAHGVAGILAALCAADRAAARPDTALREAVLRMASWLMAHSYTDSRAIVTWPPGVPTSGDPARAFSRRQAWCYGTPGVAWALWDAGALLGEPGIEQFALHAFESFCNLFDEAAYLGEGPDDSLPVCHGAAGTLAIANAFNERAQLPQAAALAERLEEYLLDHTTAIASIAATNMTLQTGAGGILAVLLMRGGASRRWLPLLALR